MEEEPETERGLPVVLRRRHKWVSQATERKIKEACGPSGLHQTCQVCQEECPSHRSLRLHVDAHFLLHFCLCGFHDVYFYPVIVHKMNYFAGEGHVVDEDCFPQYLDAIRQVIIKAITLAALTSGFQTLLMAARQKSPMVKTPSITPVTPNNTPEYSRVTTPPTKEKTPPPPGPSRLATVEERLLRLQAEFTQLDSAGRLKRRLRARQARHRSQLLQE